MKNTDRSNVRARAATGHRITDTIERALAAAGLDTNAGPLRNATATISRALTAAGLIATTHSHAAAQQAPIEAAPHARHADVREAPRATTGQRPLARAKPGAEVPRGSFLSGTFTNDAGTRTYRLYVPAMHLREARERPALVVMLHGCTQSPEDFAAGTRMNTLAEERGFLVLYPAQAADANGSRCWNWYRGKDQHRDAGEPALIAGLVREIASTHRVDTRRIYVAGLSAGGAMAVILGATYPDLFAAVGAHSGLPYASAHDMPSAFGAMHGAGAMLGALPGFSSAPSHAAMPMVPTIVFHGDADHTVVAGNGARIVQEAVAGERAGAHLTTTVVHAGAGRKYTRTVYADTSSRPIIEHWVVHGAGHAWSGGSASGSYTDSNGPDASAEMIRFFFAQQRGGTA